MFSLDLTTPELIDPDRTRVVERVQGRFTEARKLMGRRGGAPLPPVSLDELMLGAMPIDKAARQPVPSLEEALSYG